MTMHSKIKHIQICHHFIRAHIQKDDISLRFIPTDLQLANIFTKSLDEKWFVFIRRELGCWIPLKMISIEFFFYIHMCCIHLCDILFFMFINLSIGESLEFVLQGSSFRISVIIIWVWVFINESNHHGWVCWNFFFLKNFNFYQSGLPESIHELIR